MLLMSRKRGSLLEVGLEMRLKGARSKCAQLSDNYSTLWNELIRFDYWMCRTSFLSIFFYFFIFFPPPSLPCLYVSVRDRKRGGKKRRRGGGNEKEKEKWNIARNVLEIELRDAERERIQATGSFKFFSSAQNFESIVIRLIFPFVACLRVFVKRDVSRQE